MPNVSRETEQDPEQMPICTANLFSPTLLIPGPFGHPVCWNYRTAAKIIRNSGKEPLLSDNRRVPSQVRMLCVSLPLTRTRVGVFVKGRPEGSHVVSLSTCRCAKSLVGRSAVCVGGGVYRNTAPLCSWRRDVRECAHAYVYAYARVYFSPARE